MLKIYGSDLCPDCIACKKDLNEKGIPYTYINITESLKGMKEFLALRDSNAIYDPVKKAGNIGIPTIADENGELYLDWNKLGQ